MISETCEAALFNDTPKSGYDATWDCPHKPGPENEWQESDWLTFYDPIAGVGGIYRAGQEPNRGKGQPGLFVFAIEGSRYFLEDKGGRGVDHDITPGDRWTTGYRVAGHEVEALGNGRMRYRWSEADTSAELEFYESFYTPRGWAATEKGAGEMATLNADGHLECSGRIRGTIRIAGQDYNIDCMAHRDRSWGYRPAYVPRTRRIMAVWGTTGRDFNYAAMLYEPSDAEKLITGFVMRNGVGEEVDGMRIITQVDEDFVSPLGATVLLTLAGGEVIKVVCDLAQAHAGWAPGSAFNSVGTFQRNGKEGFCDFGCYVNPGRGDHRATQDEVTMAVAKPGLSKTARKPSV